MDASIQSILEEIRDALSQENVPATIMAIIGILAVALVASYLRDKESKLYKLIYIITFAAGAIFLVLDVSNAMSLPLWPRVILAVACFTAIARPFRETHIAVLLGLVVLALVYIGLDQANGIQFLQESFWAKFAIALVAAILVYALCKFVEDFVQLFGKILNFWPILLALGILCIAESLCMFAGYESIMDLIQNYAETVPQ